MSAAHPRVLLLTPNRIQSYTGGGVLLGNLFYSLPPENMFVLHVDESPPTAASVYEHRLKMRSLRPRLSSALRLLWGFCLQVLRSPFSIQRSDLLLMAVQSGQFKLSKQVDASICAFKPDVIYAWVGDCIWAHLLDYCARRYRIPYVIHFMDNHVELTGRTPLQRAIQSEYRRNLYKVVKGTSRIFTITTAMGLAYQEKFGKPFDVFHGLIDRETWPWPSPSKSSDVFSLVFTGSIEEGQLNGLRDVAAAVERLANQGQQIRLLLYVTEHYERRAREAFASFKHVEYIRHPDFSSLRSVLNAADLLILAYGFDEHCIEYYRYSFATKLVPYMLAGRCILAYGPPNIEPIAYVQRGGWAKVVCQEGVEFLSKSIAGLMHAPEQRESLARSAYDAGRKEHDLRINADRFLAAMKNVANTCVELEIASKRLDSSAA